MNVDDKTMPVRGHRVLVACSQRQCKKSTDMALALKVGVIATGGICGSVAEDAKTLPVGGHRVVAYSQMQCKK